MYYSLQIYNCTPVYSNPFSFILFCSILLYALLFNDILFLNVPFCSILYLYIFVFDQNLWPMFIWTLHCRIERCLEACITDQSQASMSPQWICHTPLYPQHHPPVTPISFCMSSFITSLNLLCGLPLVLLPSSFIFNILCTKYPLSLLCKSFPPLLSNFVS